MSGPNTAKTSLAQNVRAAEESMEYWTRRKALLITEENQVWDSKSRKEASEVELQAASIVLKIREDMP
ncbi:hypothetical protein KC318_g251 [Hortaea werneckii]|nr:hypothetical protein KC334_g246 [Hortaea werneckii]KAI7027700.1 hypothetical protein KC355_g241 [Hortaea werneckii]KAI7676458.1 hypothetical protein KC318_g251 [Hortaea werneckii]